MLTPSPSLFFLHLLFCNCQIIFCSILTSHFAFSFTTAQPAWCDRRARPVGIVGLSGRSACWAGSACWRLRLARRRRLVGVARRHWPSSARSASSACQCSTPCRRRPSRPTWRCWRRQLAELVKGEIWRRAKSKEVKCKNFMK